MNQETVEMLIDKWMNDVSFREEMRSNPHAVLEKSGITISDEDKEIIEKIDWSLSDEELLARVSKGTG